MVGGGAGMTRKVFFGYFLAKMTLFEVFLILLRPIGRWEMLFREIVSSKKHRILYIFGSDIENNRGKCHFSRGLFSAPPLKKVVG